VEASRGRGIGGKPDRLAVFRHHQGVKPVGGGDQVGKKSVVADGAKLVTRLGAVAAICYKPRPANWIGLPVFPL